MQKCHGPFKHRGEGGSKHCKSVTPPSNTKAKGESRQCKSVTPPSNTKAKVGADQSPGQLGQTKHFVRGVTRDKSPLTEW